MATGQEERTVVGRLFERIDVDALVDSLVDMFRDEMRSYGSVPDSILRGQVRDVTHRNVELFLAWAGEGREPSPDELDVLRQSAANRASEGVPLADVLHAYRLGARLCFQAVSEAAATADERDVLLGIADLFMDYVDRASSAAAEAYLAARQHDVSEEARRGHELVERLCQDAPLEEPLTRFAQAHGIALVDAYRPFALAAPDRPAHVHSQIAASLRMSGVLAVTEGERVVGLVGDGTPLAGGPYLAAIGPPLPRTRLADGLDDVRFLLDLGLRSGQDRGEVSARDHVLELVLRAADGTAGLLGEHVLGPLEGSEQVRRLDPVATLEAYVGSGLDRRATAERLGVHPNTLDHRLARISETIGADVRSPRGLTLVVLALVHRGVALGSGS